MANGQKLSDRICSGEVAGTGATLNVFCGFKPKTVTLINKTGECLLFWNDSFPDDTGYKVSGIVGGSNSTSSVTGTGTFVGTSAGALDLTTPAFSGTGFATAGQVVTTTDNQTMTLNECAGMWFIADALTSTAPVLIASNTAVTGAPAVLTVIGTAPATDAGTYKVVKNIVPTGSVTALSATAAAQTFTATAGDNAYLSSLGITPLYNGFQIGADTDVNVAAEVIYWTATK